MLESESNFLHLLLSVRKNLIKPLLEWCMHHSEQATVTSSKDQPDLSSGYHSLDGTITRNCLLCKAQVTSKYLDQSILSQFTLNIRDMMFAHKQLQWF